MIDLVAALKNGHLDSYVLSLPVNTDIAQVRGHDGYGFPKWVTDIDITIDELTTFGRINNDAGGTDLQLEAPTARQMKERSGTAVSSLNSYTYFDGGWHSPFSQRNALVSGSSMFVRDIELPLGEGRMSDGIRSLSPVSDLRLDVITSGQVALHMPTVISIS